MKIFNILKDILAPKKCRSCNSEWHFLCYNCYSQLNKYTSFCYVCKKFSEKFAVHKKCKTWIFYDNILILTHYSNPIIKKLVIDLKFYWKKEIVSDFAVYMTSLLLKNKFNIINNKNIIITNIPSTFLRNLKKWYNQSDLLAKEIWQIIGLNYKKNIVKKVKNTGQQSLLSKEKRIQNLKNAFKINKKYRDKLDKKIIILVDDVISTWTTINEVSRVLKQNWAKKVIWLVIASD